VFSAALAQGAPLVITMGGGYTRPVAASVECHADVYRCAAYRLHAAGLEEQQQGQGRAK
jgi:predicted alpha/beta-hydrolase family hydrolase